MSDKPQSAAEVPGFERLTLKEQAFVQHPDVYRDPKKAALEVGYSSSTIEKRAHSMRQRLMRFIQPAYEVRLAKVGATRERVEEELACIGFTIEDEFKERVDVEMPDGGVQTVVVWRDPATLPEHMRRAIKHAEYGSETLADGTVVQSDRPVHITLHSKEKALKELAGLFGDMVPRNPVDEQQELFDNLDIADRETLVRIHMKAARRASLKQQPIEGTNVSPPTVRRIEAPVPASPSRPRDGDGGGEGAEAQPLDNGHPAQGRGVPPRNVNRAPRTAAPRRARAPAVTEVDGDTDVGFSELP